MIGYALLDAPALESATLVAGQTVDRSTELPVNRLVRLLGFALLSGSAAAVVALAYRWYSDEAIPDGVAVITGVAVVAAWLNTKSLLDQAINHEAPPFDPLTAVFTVAIFVASAIAADAGKRLGDDLARTVFAVTASRSIDDVGRFVRSAGRTVAVTLPETIDDLEGYDPVADETRAALAGETLLFPRRLEPDRLRSRLEERLERDYGLESAVAEVDAEGTVAALAVGSRRAGIGPSLAPGQVACAIRADPAPDATPGDAVSIWTTGASESSSASATPDGEEGTTGGAERRSPTRVAEGELRGVFDDVATVAVASDDGRAVADEHYRLATLPGAPDAGREFVSILRRAPETVATFRVAERADHGATTPEAALTGAAVGSLPVAVLAIERDGEGIAFPADEETLDAGDVAYLLGNPEDLERVRRWEPAETARVAGGGGDGER